ncbi:Rab geranylgeranyltransferase [Giardia muris]|uniref:protein geranylgeranyltransferase type II n=1 Tax=Giardia muris TaxID=5742 RepID=A0A4Z1TBC4_GIAMU|nr:Rab geranylgeranyltransferase [Giardia muris]|eukprot:TNJ29829.1 Rab geranylgeranyltransferase [Giardia muris]
MVLGDDTQKTLAFLLGEIDAIRSPPTVEHALQSAVGLSGLYWALGAAYILRGRPLSDALIQEVSPSSDLTTEMIVDYVRACLVTNNDYLGQRTTSSTGFAAFSGCPGHAPHLLQTTSALQVLLMLHHFNDVISPELGLILAQTIKELQDPTTGGFHGDHLTGEIDTRYAYAAVLSLTLLTERIPHLLKRPLSALIDVPALIRHLIACFNGDGGFGTRPGDESHGGQTFCCVAALKILGAIDQIPDPLLLVWWLSQRQCTNGGLCGRPDKSPDSCYSWWIGSPLHLVLDSFETLRVPGNGQPISLSLLKDFIDACYDQTTGGVADRPENAPDAYHTFFSLASCSIFGLIDGLSPVDPALALPKVVLASSRQTQHVLTSPQRPFQMQTRITPALPLPVPKKRLDFVPMGTRYEPVMDSSRTCDLSISGSRDTSSLAQPPRPPPAPVSEARANNTLRIIMDSKISELRKLKTLLDLEQDAVTKIHEYIQSHQGSIPEFLLEKDCSAVTRSGFLVSSLGPRGEVNYVPQRNAPETDEDTDIYIPRNEEYSFSTGLPAMDLMEARALDLLASAIRGKERLTRYEDEEGCIYLNPQAIDVSTTTGETDLLKHDLELVCESPIARARTSSNSFARVSSSIFPRDVRTRPIEIVSDRVAADKSERRTPRAFGSLSSSTVHVPRATTIGSDRTRSTSLFTTLPDGPFPDGVLLTDTEQGTPSNFTSDLPPTLVTGSAADSCGPAPKPDKVTFASPLHSDSEKTIGPPMVELFGASGYPDQMSTVTSSAIVNTYTERDLSRYPSFSFLNSAPGLVGSTATRGTPTNEIGYDSYDAPSFLRVQGAMHSSNVYGSVALPLKLNQGLGGNMSIGSFSTLPLRREPHANAAASVLLPEPVGRGAAQSSFLEYPPLPGSSIGASMNLRATRMAPSSGVYVRRPTVLSTIAHDILARLQGPAKRRQMYNASDGIQQSTLGGASLDISRIHTIVQTPSKLSQKAEVKDPVQDSETISIIAPGDQPENDQPEALNAGTSLFNSKSHSSVDRTAAAPDHTLSGNTAVDEVQEPVVGPGTGE